MKPILAATAALLFVSGAALAQNTNIEAAPPAADTGSQGYPAQGTASPSTPTPARTHHHHTTHHATKHHATKHHATKHHATAAPSGEAPGEAPGGSSTYTPPPASGASPMNGAPGNPTGAPSPQ